MENKVTNTNDQQVSELVFAWKFPDHIKYHKSAWWYVISAVVLVVAVLLAVYFENILFAVFLVLFYLVSILLDVQGSKMIDFVITPDGVKVDKKFYFYRAFEEFYIVYEDNGIKALYLEFRNQLKGRLVVPFDGQDPVAIRDFLLGFLKEDLEREVEPLSERMRRWFRL